MNDKKNDHQTISGRTPRLANEASGIWDIEPEKKRERDSESTDHGSSSSRGKTHADPSDPE